MELNFSELLGKEFVLGQTRWVCRYGTLSDGHDKYTEAQKYYQAIKEMYSITSALHELDCAQLEAEADMIDAERVMNSQTTSDTDKMRAKAKFMRAKNRLMQTEIGRQDRMRMLDEYNTIRMELQDKVRARYPGGIEQAESDNWKAVFDAKMIKDPGSRIDNVCLDQRTKALKGVEWNRRDAAAMYLVDAKDRGLLESYKDGLPHLLKESSTQIEIQNPHSE